MKIIIVDDEPQIIEAIEVIISKLDNCYNVVGTSTNPHEAIGLILQHKPDVVFLDIEMPELNGLDLISLLPEIDFDIILLTRLEIDKTQSSKTNIPDYIVKPITIAQVKTALEKATLKKDNQSDFIGNFRKTINEIPKASKNRIKIATASGFDFVETDAIIRLEACGMYTHAIVKNRGEIVITKTLRKMEEELPYATFFRLHRSHIINLEHVNRFDSIKNIVIMSDDSVIPIARRRVKEFKVLLDKYF